MLSVPYFRAMYFLSRFDGPQVKDWKNDQVAILREKTTRQQNPLDRTNDALWNDLEADFTAAFTDTNRQQNAYRDLMAYRQGNANLDTYISTFRRLAREAGFLPDAAATIDIFAKHLNPKLLRSILFRQTEPVTMAEWEAAARDELRKASKRDAMLRPQQYSRWEPPPPTKGRSRRYDDDPRPYDPMDVDQPIYTQVNRTYRARRAYTEADKSRFRKEGRCFRCDKQGHMARECPTRKQQPFRPSKPPFRRKPPGPHKKAFPQYRQSPQGYIPQARAASIEEVEEYEDDEGDEEESYEERSDDLPSLAARTAKLNEGQREVWLDEMRQLGINF